MKIIGVVPARYKSSRFPGKALSDIHGKPMVWWVYRAAKKVTEFQEVYVATDDDRIYAACEKLSIKAVMTSEAHPTGTDRIGEVARKIKADLYVNIQGDEPLLEPSTIKRVIAPFVNKDTDFCATNLMTEIKKMTELLNVNVPKVVTNKDRNAVFLSRLPIPYPKSASRTRYFKQVCVYAFTPKALMDFCSFERGPLESSEDIELLRFIEHNMKVRMVEVEQEPIGVDTPDDLERVRAILKGRR